MPGSQRGQLIQRLADLVECDASWIAKMDEEAIVRPVRVAMVLDLPNAIGTLCTSTG